MKKTKIFLVVLLSLFIFTAVTVYGDNITKTIQVTYRNISILANGKQIQSEQEPFIFQGHTFVPLKTIGEALNKKVAWDNAKNQVIITDQVNPNPTVRMDSFYSLTNYLIDNYKIENTDDKLTIDEVKNVVSLSEKYLKESHFKDMKFNIENASQKNFLLTSNTEKVILSNINYKFIYDKSDYTDTIVRCLKYGDGNIYFIVYVDNRLAAWGCSDGWTSFTKSLIFDVSSETETFYSRYLVAINNSVVNDKPNRTKQITLLNSVFLNSYCLDILAK